MAETHKTKQCPYCTFYKCMQDGHAMIEFCQLVELRTGDWMRSIFRDGYYEQPTIETCEHFLDQTQVRSVILDTYDLIKGKEK